MFSSEKISHLAIAGKKILSFVFIALKKITGLRVILGETTKKNANAASSPAWGFQSIEPAVCFLNYWLVFPVQYFQRMMNLISLFSGLQIHNNGHGQHKVPIVIYASKCLLWWHDHNNTAWLRRLRSLAPTVSSIMLRFWDK